MSHQGNEYWFPECERCGCGNLGPFIICTDCAKQATPYQMMELKIIFRKLDDLTKMIFGRSFGGSLEQRNAEGEAIKSCIICDKEYPSVEYDENSQGKCVCLDCHNSFISDCNEWQKEKGWDYCYERIKELDKKVYK